MRLRSLSRAFPLILIALFVVTSGFSGCAGGDMATVTISVGHPDFAKAHTPSFFDRMLAFLSLSTRVEAGPAPLDFSIDSLTITVSAPDFDTITKDIPLDTGQLTLEVPAGNNRKFTIVAFNDDGYGFITRDYGGIVSTNLQGGATVTLTITMGNLPPQVTWPGMLYGNMYGIPVIWSASAGADGYNVYRADNYDGPYRLIQQVVGNTTTTYFDEDVIIETLYFYRIAGYNSNGEGTLSEPEMGMAQP